MFPANKDGSQIQPWGLFPALEEVAAMVISTFTARESRAYGSRCRLAVPLHSLWHFETTQMWLSERTGTSLEPEPEHTLTAKVLGKRARSQGLRPGFKYPQGSCVTQDRPLTSLRVIFGGDLCEITRVVVTIVSNDGLRHRGASLNSGVPEWGWSTPRGFPPSTPSQPYRHPLWLCRPSACSHSGGP